MEDPKKLEEGFGNQKNNISEENIDTNRIDNNQDLASHENELKTLSQPLQKEEEEQPTIKKGKRVATLDAFRGLTIVLMILVDDAGGAYARIDHSPWNGCTLADFVMPFFLFIVGVAIALALKRVPKVSAAIRKVTLRTLKLLFWGIILQGGYSHAPYDLAYGVDMKVIRWCGILQRIALVYLIVALIEILTTKLRPTTLTPGHFSIFTAYKWQWLGGFVAFVVYMTTLYGLYVPDWNFLEHDGDTSQRYTVKCGMRGHLGPACNAVGYVDRQVWGINHLYNQPVWARSKACTLSYPETGPFRDDAPTWCRAPFEPEGLLSSISAIMSGTIGIHYGHVLIHFKIDVLGMRIPFLWLEWIGMNAMLIFVMGAQGIFAGFINGWYFKNEDNNLVNWIQHHVFFDVWKSQRLGTLLYVIFAEITFWAVLAGILHRLGIYWKL
uniref:D8Ertd354e protein n=1 Tax=Solanum tuberosum TaxID=4113 RepID=M0ZX64_SOLTU